ncbi:IclR family transcriptional regulator [Amylibacter cionae]|uniref:IclR family transcriptional regulator n=2 Tax=Neptunicoccus cionae TaxID=2035344 RepID=A0A916R1J4_9RHOB|nr:IclR family transcriptional regulator [Amylibacter cionae]
MKAFDENHTEMSLPELAERTGLEKSAVQRLANTLHLEGMLEKDPHTRRFRPSHAFLNFAYSYLWSDPLIPVAMPKLIDLSQELGETINLAEMSGDHIIYVSRLPCKRTYFAATVIGRRLPVLSTSSGRAMLGTHPDEVRQQAVADWTLRRLTPSTTLDREEIARSVEKARIDGFAISRNQMILNEIGVAAPICGPSGVAYAAIQCSVSSFQWSEDEIQKKIVPLLLDTANAMGPALRH